MNLAPKILSQIFFLSPSLQEMSIARKSTNIARHELKASFLVDMRSCLQGEMSITGQSTNIVRQELQASFLVDMRSCLLKMFLGHARNGPLEFWRSLKRLGLEEVQVPLVCALAGQLLHSRSGWSLQSSNIEYINKI